MLQVLAWAIKLVYRVFRLFPQTEKIAFLSRQSADSLDFRLLEPALLRTFPGCSVVRVCRPGSLTVSTMLSQLWHAATAKLIVVDGYIPAVSIPGVEHRGACIQIWHALGAVKKFAYQSLDTPAGHSSAIARAFSMHRGYDCVVAGFPGAVPAYAEAFRYPVEKILPLGLPRCDYLTSPDYAALREERASALRPYRELAVGYDRVVLYAPTFRKGAVDEDWFAHAVQGLDAALAADTLLLVSAHPLDARRLTGAGCSERVRLLEGVATIDAYGLADVVVTDYSAVSFEAALAGLRLVFFVPDIDEYRTSPGLNLDPELVCPGITARAVGDVARLCSEDGYDEAALATFCGGYGIVPGAATHAVRDIVDCAVRTMRRKAGEGR